MGTRTRMRMRTPQTGSASASASASAPSNRTRDVSRRGKRTREEFEEEKEREGGGGGVKDCSSVTQSQPTAGAFNDETPAATVKRRRRVLVAPTVTVAPTGSSESCAADVDAAAAADGTTFQPTTLANQVMDTAQQRAKRSHNCPSIDQHSVSKSFPSSMQRTSRLKSEYEYVKGEKKGE